MVERAGHFAVAERWPVEVAAMLSQIGYVTLPAKTPEKIYKAEALSSDEERMVERIPHLLEQLLGHIPRRDAVRDILRYHMRLYNGGTKLGDGVVREAIPWGARAEDRA
jgi:response regulator RpfG family c-di-GMP phosphodiesterase